MEDTRDVTNRINPKRCHEFESLQGRFRHICVFDECREKGFYDSRERVHWKGDELILCHGHRRLLRDLRPQPDRLVFTVSKNDGPELKWVR